RRHASTSFTSSGSCRSSFLPMNAAPANTASSTTGRTLQHPTTKIAVASVPNPTTVPNSSASSERSSLSPPAYRSRPPTPAAIARAPGLVQIIRGTATAHCRRPAQQRVREGRLTERQRRVGGPDEEARVPVVERERRAVIRQRPGRIPRGLQQRGGVLRPSIG